MNSSYLSISLLVLAVFVAGCGKKEEVSQSPKFDAKAIAAEADKGNLDPLTELNKACTAEVEKNGKRMAVCGVQDEVGKLTKPLSVRF
ncbi:hypothetical protein J7E70_26565 [Variovorax paradoxus]|nr:hypothetical protein [Variovorax paradoxus]MBT2304006.1 hypothetical protein [Variovorax paradoxus]